MKAYARSKSRRNTLYKSCPPFKGSRPPVFVTGGVGGVHRGGESSLDVSADLVELGRSRVPVVSAGVKSILDIGRTLEFLVRLSAERVLMCFKKLNVYIIILPSADSLVNNDRLQ